MHRIRRRPLVLLLALLLLAGCGKRYPYQPPPPTPAPPTPAPVSETPPAPALPDPPPPSPPPAPPELPGTLLVMVENQFEARPQSGLNLADRIFEMNGDAGITRYLAVFYQHKAEKIGPVRSARMYYYQVARAFRAPYAHAGANADVLSAITIARKHEGFPDLDDIYSGGDCFWRSKDRKAPHNLYTSTDDLVRCAKERNQPMTPLAPLPAGDIAGGTPSTWVHLSFSGDSPSIAWRWQDGRWQRDQEGKPHVMQDGTALAADNLVVMWAPHKWFKPYNDDWEWKIDIVGSGKARFFRNGKTYTGTWSKASPDDQFVFKQDDGSLFPFAPGTAFFEVLKESDPFSFEGQ